MEYREHRVAPPLDLFVECIWSLTTLQRVAIEEPEQRILPDGCIELIVHLGERFHGLTPRHLQRRFAARVGVTPKTLARILRFQNTLRHRAAQGGRDWLRIAIDCGYTDQSHLIRDYAEFAGETPVGLRAAEGELSAYFTAPQRLAALFGERR